MLNLFVELQEPLARMETKERVILDEACEHRVTAVLNLCYKLIGMVMPPALTAKQGDVTIPMEMRHPASGLGFRFSGLLTPI